MPSKPKTVKAAAPRKDPKKTAKSKPAKALKPKAKKPEKASQAASTETAQILSSEVVYQGKLFRVLHDKIVEPDGKHNERDVIRHNGSVVILALDSSKNKKNPWIVIERQYRHAANQY